MLYWVPRTIQHEIVVSEAAAAPAAPAMNTDACSIHSKAFQDVCLLATECCFSFSSVWCIKHLVNHFCDVVVRVMVTYLVVEELHVVIHSHFALYSFYHGENLHFK